MLRLGRAGRGAHLAALMIFCVAAFGQSGLAQGPAEGPAAQPHAEPTSIYIPYKKLREVFEQEGRGVFLPYEQFRSLWDAAHDRPPPPPTPTSPVDAVINQTSNEATVAHDVVRVASVVRIELLKKGWIEVPLQLGDVAITKAVIAKKPARILSEKGGGYRLLYEKRTDEPESIALELEYAKAFTKSPGRNSVSFNVPRAPISRWRVTIPEPGVRVNLSPLIAATEVPVDLSDDQQTVILAFVGAAPVVGIDWTPRSEGAMGLAALVNVNAQQIVWIEEGVTRVRADLAYTISRDELKALTVEVPAAYKVVNVADANVRQWSVSTGGAPGVQRVAVELFEPAKGSQNIRLELENFTTGEDQRALEVPRIRAMDVARQQGVLVISSAVGLRADVIRTAGLVQMDAGELPSSLGRGSWDFAYRYSTMPFALEIAIEKVQPYVTVDALVRAYLDPEQLRLDMLAVFNIERAGVFQLELDVPEGFEVRTVRGRRVGNAAAVAVDTHHLGGEDSRKLFVSLARRALGKVGLELQLVRDLDVPQLLTPTGTPVDIDLAIPRVAATTADRENGRLIVLAPDSLRVDAERTDGLRSVSTAEAVKGMGDEATAAPAFTPMLAFVYSQDPVVAVLAVERRRPYVTVRQLLTAKIEPGVIRYDATFFYDIRYSGVRSLRIDIPADLASSIRNTTAGVRDKPIEPAPDDVGEGSVAWSFTGEREFMGAAQIRLTWERKLEKLDVGKSVDIAVPRLEPRGADRAWGQVVLTKAETIDIHATGEPTGVRPIDPQHDLMPGVTIAGAARAFEFHDSWSLSVTATHYALEEVKRTSIERALVRIVVTRSNEVSVQALYRMRSARQRLMVTFPAGVKFDTRPVRINGQATTLERGDKDDFFVGLVGQDPASPFLLELRYTLSKSDAPGRLAYPVFPDEPAVQKVYLSVFFPREQAWLGSKGGWTDEMVWRPDPESVLANWVPIPRQDEGSLIAWVSEGIGASSGNAGGLQTDGRRYLFSTLRPSAPPEGALAMVMMNQRALNLIVFLLIVGSGLILVRGQASTRWVAAGSLLIAIVLLGVFMPTFSLQVTDGVLLAAVLVVLIVWAVWYVARTRPRDPIVLARRAARHDAAFAALSAAVTGSSSPIPSAQVVGPPMDAGEAEPGQSDRPAPDDQDDKGNR